MKNALMDFPARFIAYRRRPIKRLSTGSASERPSQHEAGLTDAKLSRSIYAALVSLGLGCVGNFDLSMSENFEASRLAK
jgi:hypothetical protein